MSGKKTSSILHTTLANSLRAMPTKFYPNRWCFVEEMTKTFWCVFSLHRCTYNVLMQCVTKLA